MNFKGYQVPNLSKAFKKLLSNSVVFKTKDRSPSPITHHPSPITHGCFHVFSCLFSRFSRNDLSIAGHRKHQKDCGIVEGRLWSNEKGIMTN